MSGEAVDYLLTVDEIPAIRDDLIERHGGARGLRDAGQLEAASFPPQTGYYPDVIAQAAPYGKPLAKPSICRWR